VTPPEPLGAAFRQVVCAALGRAAGAADLDGVLLLDPANVTYATGFHFSVNERPVGAWLPARPDRPVLLLVPLLERENAWDAGTAEVRCYDEFPGPQHPVLWMLRETGATRVGVDFMGAAEWQVAVDRLARLELTDAAARLRAVKRPEELALIRAAARYADLCLEAILEETTGVLRSGGGETAILAAGLRAAQDAMRRELPSSFAGTKCGMTGTVHTGPRAALPHGRTLPRVPVPGETMIAGIGASVGGYHAESGATFVIGQPDAETLRCLRVAEATDRAARDALRPGTPCEVVNQAAMAVLREAGLADAIRHRIGHGMGVAGHEAPWLAPGDVTRLKPGMVFSNEPGIYRPGRDGYRTINTMILQETEVEIPSQFQARVPIEARMLAP